MPSPAEFASGIEKAVVNMARLDEFINEVAPGTVVTDNGSIPNLATYLEDIADSVSTASISGIPGLQDALDDNAMRLVNLPATLGSQLGIGYRASYNGADARYLGGMWPATNYCAWLFEAKFTAANTPGVGESPASTAFFYAENNGSGKDVLAGMFVTYLKTATGAGFATNHIVTGDIGLLGAKYICAEFDVQPAVGATVNPNSIGLPINAFNAAIPTCIQIGAAGGGSWGNGVTFYNVTGACLAGGTGASLGSLFNTGSATYAGAAGIFSNGHSLQFSGTASSHFTVRTDGSNNLRIKFGGGALVYRDPTDTHSIAAIGSDGSAAFGENASVAAGYKVDAAADISGDGIGLFRGRTSTGDISIEVQTATGTVGNAAACTLRLRANGTTSRSINAGGTINASGADYAEYERLGSGVSGFVKGAVVGFDIDGLLTDRFANAVRFGVKSTNPNLVGGDDWADDVPQNPERPVFVAPPYTGTSDPGPMAPKADYAENYSALRDEFLAKVRAHKEMVEGDPQRSAVSAEIESIQIQLQEIRDAKDAADLELHAKWEDDCVKFSAESATYEDQVSEVHEEWLKTTFADWQEEVSTLEEQREELRATVERIAYCGKVPVNVTGAAVGQYLIPCDDGSGGITATGVDAKDITFQQSLQRLGKVNRILDDGRAETVVLVG